MKIPLPFATLEKAAIILNGVRQEQGLPAIWCADQFLQIAMNGDLDVTVLLPETFRVSRKDNGPKFLDTPLRPWAPKDAAHFFVDKPELFALSLRGTAELKRIVSISNDGVRSILHSVDPPMTVSLSDVRINMEQLFRYVAAHDSVAAQGAVAAHEPVATHEPSPARRHKLRTNLLDAPIRKAIRLAGCLETSAVFSQLRELALEEAAPFTGQFDEKGAICYTNDNNKPALLTKDGLAKRLKRHSL